MTREELSNLQPGDWINFWHTFKWLNEENYKDACIIENFPEMGRLKVNFDIYSRPDEYFDYSYLNKKGVGYIGKGKPREFIQLLRPFFNYSPYTKPKKEK